MRLLIGLLLAISISFACDKPYEEVGGYKIGCPFVDSDGFELTESIEPIKMSRYTKETSGVFESVSIATINNDIAWVGFLTERDKPFLENDTQDIIHSLESRWGAFSEDFGGFVNTPNNQVINEIRFYASSNPDDNVMMLMYKSNNMMKAEEELERQSELDRQKELSSF